MPIVPTGYDFVNMVSEHYEAMLSFYGEELGHKVSRKHLGWYMDEVGTGADLRRSVLTTKTPADVLRMLPDALSDQGEVAA